MIKKNKTRNKQITKWANFHSQEDCKYMGEEKKGNNCQKETRKTEVKQQMEKEWKRAR